MGRVLLDGGPSLGGRGERVDRRPLGPELPRGAQRLDALRLERVVERAHQLGRAVRALERREATRREPALGGEVAREERSQGADALGASEDREGARHGALVGAARGRDPPAEEGLAERRSELGERQRGGDAPARRGVVEDAREDARSVGRARARELARRDETGVPLARPLGEVDEEPERLEPRRPRELEGAIGDRLAVGARRVLALELPGPARRLPVWVQDHAFERLRQRIPAPSIEGYTHGTLFESLRHPRITANQGDGTFLVEYRWHDVRVGHLAVTVLEDAVLVRTFLFLTMQGTPEAAKLRARLKLKRRDIEWLDLDSFSVFLLSDMGKDPELKRIFDECGCGHLLTLVPASGEPAMKVADEVRKYLKLGDPVRRDRARQEPE